MTSTTLNTGPPKLPANPHAPLIYPGGEDLTFLDFSIRATFLGGPTKDPYAGIQELQYSAPDGSTRTIEYVHIKASDVEKDVKEINSKHYSMGRKEYYGERFFNKLVYVCHGVGRGLDSMSINRWKAHAVQNNVNVVVHNYPGYGNTTGPPSEESINGDSLYLLKYIVNIRNEEKKLQDSGNVKNEDRAKDVVLLGNSIGCGPTMWLAATPETRDLGIDRVLLISPWTSLLYLWPSLLRKFYIDGKDRNKLPENIWGALKPEEVLSDKYLGIWQKIPGCDSFESLKAVKNLPKTLKGKFIIIHGEDDDTIFPHHSETLAKEMKDIVDPKLYVLKGFDHSHARPWADELIWGFVHDDEKLEDHVKTVTNRRGLPPYVYNPRGNLGND